jgi:hypothetical protein
MRAARFPVPAARRQPPRPPPCAVICAMDTEPIPRASRAPSQAFTVALVKPDSGSSPNDSMAFAEQVVHPSCNRGRKRCRALGTPPGVNRPPGLSTLSRSCSVLYYRHS